MRSGSCKACVSPYTDFLILNVHGVSLPLRASNVRADVEPKIVDSLMHIHEHYIMPNMSGTRGVDTNTWEASVTKSMVLHLPIMRQVCQYHDKRSYS